MHVAVFKETVSYGDCILSMVCVRIVGGLVVTAWNERTLNGLGSNTVLRRGWW